MNMSSHFCWNSQINDQDRHIHYEGHTFLLDHQSMELPKKRVLHPNSIK